jgi:hypothetical protein
MADLLAALLLLGLGAAVCAVTSALILRGYAIKDWLTRRHEERIAARRVRLVLPQDQVDANFAQIISANFEEAS